MGFNLICGCDEVRSGLHQFVLSIRLTFMQHNEHHDEIKEMFNHCKPANGLRVGVNYKSIF